MACNSLPASSRPLFISLALGDTTGGVGHSLDSLRMREVAAVPSPPGTAEAHSRPLLTREPAGPQGPPPPGAGADAQAWGLERPGRRLGQGEAPPPRRGQTSCLLPGDGSSALVLPGAGRPLRTCPLGFLVSLYARLPGFVHQLLLAPLGPGLHPLPWLAASSTLRDPVPAGDPAGSLARDLGG